MEQVKNAAIEAHESLRLVLYQLEHLCSDFDNEMPKYELGKNLSNHFSELIKITTTTIYNCTDFCFALNEVESFEDINKIIEGVEV